MDAGCAYTCQPLRSDPLPPLPGLFLAPDPAAVDVDWIARRVLLFPATHTCELASPPPPPRQVGNECDKQS